MAYFLLLSTVFFPISVSVETLTLGRGITMRMMVLCRVIWYYYLHPYWTFFSSSLQAFLLSLGQVVSIQYSSHCLVPCQISRVQCIASPNPLYLISAASSSPYLSVTCNQMSTHIFSCLYLLVHNPRKMRTVSCLS